MSSEMQDKQTALDCRYIRMAQIWAENSYCKRRQVGALLVKNKTIISDGYNGTPAGFKNICEDAPECLRQRVHPAARPGSAGHPQRFLWLIHPAVNLSQVKKLVQHPNSIFTICNSTLLLLHEEVELL